MILADGTDLTKLNAEFIWGWDGDNKWSYIEVSKK